MRVLFLGNAPGYSDHFAATLVRRSNRRADPVELVGIVCPRRQVSPRYGRQFPHFLRVIRFLQQLLGSRVSGRIFGQRGRIYLAMQHHASQARVPVLYPVLLDEVLEPLRRLGPDLCVVAGLNRILKPHLIERFPPVYNIHPSLLPAYRGGTPEFWQLADGAQRGGVTLHRIDRGIDTGPIVVQHEFPIPPWFDASELAGLSITTGLGLMNEFLDGYPAVAHRSVPQNGAASYHPFPAASDRIAPFASSARSVFNRARAYGWANPLVVYVDRQGWSANEVLVATDAGESTLELQMFDPVPFEDQADVLPGTVRRTASGGVTLACAVGTVLFRRAYPA